MVNLKKGLLRKINYNIQSNIGMEENGKRSVRMAIEYIKK